MAPTCDCAAGWTSRALGLLAGGELAAEAPQKHAVQRPKQSFANGPLRMVIVPAEAGAAIEYATEERVIAIGRLLAATLHESVTG